MGARRAIVAVALTTGVPGSGRAAEAPGATGDAHLPVISLDMSACPYDEAEVRRLLGIELEAKVIGPASRTGDMSSVSVTCADDVYQIVVVSRTDPTKVRRRELDLASTGPKARGRFLALAMIELITTRWPDPPAAEVVVVPRSAPAPSAAPAATTSARFAAGPVARVFPAGAASPATFGGAFRAAWSRDAFELACDVVAEAGTTSVALGEVTARSGSLGPSVGLRGASGRWGWRAGGGARLGIAQLEGRATDARQTGTRIFSAPWGGPFASAGGSARLAGGFLVELGVELGWAAASIVGRALDAGGSRVADVSWRGPWAALGLTLGWATR